MNQLIRTGQITEMGCGANFAYILGENSAFLPTEYKVLQSQGGSSFVKCMKMLYNGKTQLFFLTSGYKSLSAMFPKLDAESFLVIVTNLLKDVLDVKNNGFLSCANIDVSFDKIFVDPATYEVKLVYLPLKSRFMGDTAAFENELRTMLIKTISEFPAMVSSKTNDFAGYLADGTMSMDDLYQYLKGGKAAVRGQGLIDGGKDGHPVSSHKLKIVALNAPMRVEIEVTKDEFVLGKKQDAVDGWLSFNKMISRVHCKILRSGNRFQIVDMESANGTFVNKKRIQSNIPVSLNNGDVVRLANSDFQIVID